MSCRCVLEHKYSKCPKDVVCDSCGICMAWCGYSEDQKICIDCGEFDYYTNIAKENGIQHSVWSISDDVNGRLDFTDDHPFPTSIKYVISNNKYCCQGWGRVAIKGKKWIDIWKACDELCRGSGCDHRFIEGFRVVGYMLYVQYGS